MAASSRGPQGRRSSRVERAGGLDGVLALCGQPVPALLDVLSFNLLLVVPAFHQVRRLQPRHHLIKGRTGVPDAKTCQQLTQVPSGLFG